MRIWRSELKSNFQIQTADVQDCWNTFSNERCELSVRGWTLTFYYVSAGQYHSIKQSTVPARLQLSILAKPYLFVFCLLLFVTLWSHSGNNEEWSGSVLWISAL